MVTVINCYMAATFKGVFHIIRNMIQLLQNH